MSPTTARPRTGQVHFGPGAFFRAFGAIYTQDAIDAAGGDWGITAVSLKSPTARDQLAARDGVYTACTLAPEGRVARQIGAITRLLVAPEDPQAVIAALADPAVHVVTLTITEKGYGWDAATHGLDTGHSDIAYDLQGLDAPRSAAGFLVAGLARRRATGAGPVTILSCDNLPDNGAVTRAVVTGMADRVAPEMRGWITDNVRFPSSMVDRITPATTLADIAAGAALTGIKDPGLIVHEPFRQWVVEDNFAAPRPAWDHAGAQLVADVAPFEYMKLRCLNGTHSALAYLGYLAGHATIAETVADAPFEALCEALWRDEITPTVPTPPGTDLATYCADLLTRYRNPNIQHRTWQIAMDGSQKLPQRILGTIRDRRAAGAMPRGLALVVAGWMHYVSGRDLSGQEIDVRDPLADRLAEAAQGADAEQVVARMMALSEVFAEDLAQDAALRDEIMRAHRTLSKKGARQAVQAYLDGAS